MFDAAAIRQARERLGESQAEFAKRFGVNQSTVHRWEHEGPPDAGTAKLAIDTVLKEIVKEPAE